MSHGSARGWQAIPDRTRSADIDPNFQKSREGPTTSFNLGQGIRWLCEREFTSKLMKTREKGKKDSAEFTGSVARGYFEIIEFLVVVNTVEW